MLAMSLCAGSPGAVVVFMSLRCLVVRVGVFCLFKVFRGLVRICYTEVTGCLDITFCFEFSRGSVFAVIISRCLEVEVASGLSRGLTGHCRGGPFCIF